MSMKPGSPSVEIPEGLPLLKFRRASHWGHPSRRRPTTSPHHRPVYWPSGSSLSSSHTTSSLPSPPASTRSISSCTRLSQTSTRRSLICSIFVVTATETSPPLWDTMPATNCVARVNVAINCRYAGDSVREAGPGAAVGATLEVLLSIA